MSERPSSATSRVGLRLRLVLAIGGITVLAFVPLFLAIAWLTTDQVASAHQRAALAIADTTGRLACADPSPAALERLLHAGDGVDGIEVNVGGVTTQVGKRSSPLHPRETGTRIYADSDHGFSIPVRCEGAGARVRFRPEQVRTEMAPELRLLSWYLALFALALLVFLYTSMTRLIVRPLDRLVLASERVAGGALRLEVPRTGTRELDELGSAVQTMTARLRGEEEALRLKVDELTRTTERLREARDQVMRSDRLASVGRLAAGLAHEVGNPLAALLGLEDLLLGGDLDPEAQQDFLGRMKKETERIHGVMRDLLDYARTDSPASVRSEPVEPADIGEVARDLVRLVTPQKALRGVTLDLEVDERTAAVALPAAKLTQLLLNLVMNAAHAIGASATSEASETTGRIVVRARTTDGRTRLEVEDDGPGVPAELRDRLFEPFVTSKPAGEGTGLGLAVCRALVDAAGGSILVEDVAPHGARFVIDLPAGAPQHLATGR
jgi:two-component system NtrC family sensor kinase